MSLRFTCPAHDGRLLIAVVFTFFMSCLVASTQADSPRFEIDVMSVLSKAGCNSGLCHGNQNGKGGLLLSLRGQDSVFDYRGFAWDQRGRRINRIEPHLSLLLLKPTGIVPHEGGVRFRVDSAEYRILHDWIAAGAKPPSSDLQLVSLHASPDQAVMIDPRAELQLQVTARFDDGSERDVTNLACYEVSNLLASVTKEGRVSRAAFGESTIVARYLDQQIPIRVAFIPQRDFAWSAPPANNFIDHLVFDKLQQLRINPSRLSDDSTFIRRTYLDVLGVLPTSDEARSFVADTQSDKRGQLIDRLLEREEFNDFWALKWCDLLRVEEKVLDGQGVPAFHAWIRKAMADRKPLDQFVRELLRGTGSTYDNPAANYYRANRDAATRGETTARLFLGIRLQCAKCHNHPFDRWTQDDYYAWASVFAPIDYEIKENNRRDRLDKNEFNGEQIVNLLPAQQVRNPRTGNKALPRLLGSATLSPGSHYDQLTPLAVWLTAPDNDLFAKTQVNFVWYHLMGRGLVEPIDDFRMTNPAINPPLLEALAKDFVEHGFDLRHLVRTILKSHVYQLSSLPNASNANDDNNFSHALVKRLGAEVLIDAQSQVVDAAATFEGFPAGVRAVQLPGTHKVHPRDARPTPGDRFLRTFGKSERLLACECERSNETTLKQAFALISDNGLQRRLQKPGNRLDRWLSSELSSEQLIDELYWTALSRPPGAKELLAGLEMLGTEESARLDQTHLAWARLLGREQLIQQHNDRFVVLQDLAWALLNVKEFVFRH